MSSSVSIQNKIGSIFLLAGAGVSVVLYLGLAWIIFRGPIQNKKLAKTDLTPHPKIFVASPGISFQLSGDRHQYMLSLQLFTSTEIEFSHLQVKASESGRELCTFVDTVPMVFPAMSLNDKMIKAAVTQIGIPNISIGSIITLFGTLTFRRDGQIHNEPINMVTIAHIEPGESSFINLAEYRKKAREAGEL